MNAKRAIASVLLTISAAAAPARADLVHQWKFNGFATDSVGSAHGTFGGGASIVGDRLSLDGIDDQVLTSPIDATITERTLVSWVSLNDLNQPGGGSALSIQVGAGSGAAGFDGIVYGERAAMQWMAGSNGFSRSVLNNGGAAETVTNPGEVMMAITYAANNDITIYRNGAEYASAANATQGSINTYTGGVADVLFGRRHDGAGNPLNGFVNEARIYNEVLSPSEIADVFADGPDLSPSDPPPPPPGPELLHQWTFNGDARDQVGMAHGALSGGAALVGDRLSLDGVAGSLMRTGQTGNAIAAKTLVSWVSLNDFTISNKGSVLTLQNNAAGSIFDGIVYGEAAAQKWMAGSNGFARTQNPQTFGTEETVGEPGEVMMAIVYDADNSITLYRNGVEYGSYTKGSLQSFATNALVQIGPRHGDNPAVFDGFINEARIYGGALDAAAISDLFAEGPSLIANPPPPGPELRHQWTFEDGTADDSVGTAHGQLLGGAQIAGGRLQLDGIDDSMRSATIDETISSKTMIAWVSLDNLTQRAGSVLSLENPTGADVFDGIVFGERTAGQWMNGSNNFARSKPDNGGAAETVAAPGEVMLAIVYEDDGSITMYRDGAFYADATQGTLQTYPADVSDVLIGLRHVDSAGVVGTADGADPYLAGSVNEARIYSGALTAADIESIYNAGPVPEPGTAVLALLALAGALVARRRRPE
jgi:hypothetical protein